MRYVYYALPGTHFFPVNLRIHEMHLFPQRFSRLTVVAYVGEGTTPVTMVKKGPEGRRRKSFLRNTPPWKAKEVLI